MYKIAVVGDKESIFGFSSIGIDIYPAYEEKEIEQIISKLMDENYAIIYVTENMWLKAEKYLEKLQKNNIPAIVSIPSNTGSLNYGEKRIKDMVQKAVGIEINFWGNERNEYSEGRYYNKSIRSFSYS